MGMVTVDQSMAGDAEIDYADFATQMVYQTNESDSFGTALSEIEPLRGRGGLSNNEVAELLYLETNVTIEIQDNVDDQNVGTSAHGTGIVGINLDQREDLVEESSVSGNDEELSGVAFAESNIVTDNAYLQQYSVDAGLPFDDQSTGVGGGASNDSFHAEKYFRQTHGRGPVLDQTDDITIINDLFVNDAIITCKAEVLLTMYWDVAETSDAGRRFSLP